VSARCGLDAIEWVARCAQSSGVPMKLIECPSGLAIVEAGPALRIEISTSPNAFARVRKHGFSPVGSFADWKEEPAARRDAFDAVVHCAERSPPDALLAPQTPPDPTIPSAVAPYRAPPPFLLLAGLVVALFAVRLKKTCAYAAVGTLAVFIARSLLRAPAFFHQNGQGPSWADFVLRGDAGDYGPGYVEVFGWVATRAQQHDLAIFTMQRILAATVPISAYCIVRASGGRRVAVVIACALAIDPVAMRIGASESYFAVIFALLFMAAAIVTTASSRVLGYVAAGLLVAQAARIHPVAWVACATIPLPLLFRAGRLKNRLRDGALACAVIGGIGLVLTLPLIRAVLAGRLGSQFLPTARAVAIAMGPRFAIALLVCGAFAVRSRMLGIRAFALVFTVAVASISNVVMHDSPVVSAAYVHLFLPAAVLPIAFLAARHHLGPYALAVVAALHIAIDHRKVPLPTDALEQSWALEWRSSIPRDATITAVGKAGERVFALPLRTYRPVEHKPNDVRFYYRSSLCSTPEGAPLCARFESEHRLAAIMSRRFPARASLPWLPLPEGEIEATLFRVEGTR
jgi:hypothetical protein